MIEIELIRQSRSYQAILDKLQGGNSISHISIQRSARLPVLTTLQRDLNCPIAFITDRSDRAQMLLDEIDIWLDNGKRYYFPEPNPLFYERGGWGISTRRDRLETLASLLPYHLPVETKPQPPFIISTIRAVMTRTLPRRDYIKFTHTYQAGYQITIPAMIKSWDEIGYLAADSVTEAGQFSHRGGLLDIWVPGTFLPVRLDFFGDKIETIRSFDPATQRTVNTQYEITIYPAREILPVKARTVNLDDSSIEEFNIPIAHPSPSSLLDYLPKNSLIVFDDQEILQQVAYDVEEQAVKMRQDSIRENLIPSDFPIPYLSMVEVEDSVGFRLQINMDSSNPQSPEELNLDFKPEVRFAGRLIPFIDTVHELCSTGDTVIIVSKQIERIKELWSTREKVSGVTQNFPKFYEGGLSDGWVFYTDNKNQIHLLTDGEIFGWERPKSRQRHLPISETPETAYADLKPGDWVVHVDHGIGQYVGMNQKTIEGLVGEYLTINFQGGDQLFVPIYQADRLTRYIGPDNRKPTQTRLSSSEWTLAKQRVRDAVEQIARELLELYAKRQTSQGFAFSPDKEWQKELESSFPYIETADQIKAIESIKSDMENSRPMDRLLCGDVGYGKTEVALRAAFKAVMDGKQVAILVPTTVLAQQHYETFSQRLAAFPIQVAMLSRFKTVHEQDEIILKLASGAVDIVIGTHRLLQSDIQFKDLGLVIIDEEQRFGVTHKEFLKKLRLEVDVLTLTATPIPRTLYMALTGVRDISTINTPPDERLPITTHIGPYSPHLIRQAVLRELERGGQVFFVHNRVQTIPAMYTHLQNLLPEARIGIAHGQQPEENLSTMMKKFTHHDIDILLCTSIIESGLDIPNANTLIVDRADAFGLAQLYQLRGRVGRGTERAYAYFFRHKHRLPTQDGQERLDVIAENTQLGAGYSIAMRDLEIRGAGELLGTRQHGYIASVGFHLYTRLLAQAVKKQRTDNGQLNPDLLAMHLPLSVNIDLPLNIGIPSTYIPDQNLRLRLYRRLADIQDISEIENLRTEFIDRFGIPVEEVENLFFQIEVKLLAELAGLASIGSEGDQLVMKFPAPQNNSIGLILPNLGNNIRTGKNKYWMKKGEDNRWRIKLLQALHEIIEIRAR